MSATDLQLDKIEHVIGKVERGASADALPEFIEFLEEYQRIHPPLAGGLEGGLNVEEATRQRVTKLLARANALT